MTTVSDPTLPSALEERALLREHVLRQLRRYRTRAEGRHRAPVARLHRCARCGTNGSIGRAMRFWTRPTPWSGHGAVCRDGLACSLRRAAGRREA